MTTKEALSNSMSNAAAHANRVRSLLELAKVVPEDLFIKCVGQYPDTMPRDLAWADSAYQRAKTDYETHCREIGVPAYQTYNED